MRTSPSIVPHGADQDTYLVMDDFGRLGCAWRETDTESADRETLIRHLIKGEYNNPVRIVAFNISRRTSPPSKFCGCVFSAIVSSISQPGVMLFKESISASTTYSV